MAKVIKVNDVIYNISKLYRTERGKVCDILNEIHNVSLELDEHDKNGGKNITVAEYNNLLMKKRNLEHDKEIQESYCNGIFIARELFIAMGLDTTIDTNN